MLLTEQWLNASIRLWDEMYERSDRVLKVLRDKNFSNFFLLVKEFLQMKL